MTEELFWKRVSNLWRIYTSITDDLVYRAMWEKKLKELMEKGFENGKNWNRNWKYENRCRWW